MSRALNLASRTLPFLLLCLVSLSWGCADDDPNDQPILDDAEVLSSSQQRITSPEVDESDFDELVAGNTAFAVDLFHQLAGENPGENLFLSPHSISIALAMTYAGAEGDTETAMADTLHFALAEPELHEAFNLLDLTLMSRGEGSQGIHGEPFRLEIVNQLWGQTGYPFNTDFIDVLGLNYGAALRLLDFMADPDGARQVINAWVADRTNDLIEELLPENSITSLTRLVLTNCIYFNAAWSLPFPDEATTNGTFTTYAGTEVTLPMMRNSDSFAYAEGDGFQAVELLYDGQEVSMVVILPEAGEYDAFEAGLDSELLGSILNGMEIAPVILTLPRFEMRTEFSLRDALTTLGMGVAFDDALANLSDIATSRENLYIADVIHEAVVTVTESGTEAAAATAVIVAGRGPGEDVVMTVDRPFITLIRDVETGAILFMGRYLGPEI